LSALLSKKNLLIHDFFYILNMFTKYVNILTSESRFRFLSGYPPSNDIKNNYAALSNKILHYHKQLNVTHIK